MDEPQQKPLDPFAPDVRPEAGTDSERPDQGRAEICRDMPSGELDAAIGASGSDAMNTDYLPWSLDEPDIQPAGPPLDSPQADPSEPELDTLADEEAVRRLDALRETTSKWPPPRRGPGLLGHLLSVITGGIMGLAIGYWLLNWLGGSQFDMLGLPLPGIPHTHSDTLPTEEAEGEADTIDVPPAPELNRQFVPNGPQTRPDDQTSLADVDEQVTAAPLVEAAPLESAQVPLPEGYIGPRDFTPYGFDELAEALAAAGATASCKYCSGTGLVTEIIQTPSGDLEGDGGVGQRGHRVPCDQCVGHPAATMTTAVYERFCRLAQVATFVQVDAVDADLRKRQDSLRLVLLRSAEGQRNLDTIGRLARRRLEAADGHDTGILLAGTVHETAREGKIHLVRIVLFGRPKVVTIASARSSILRPRDRVIILGTVVRRPSENLVGYEGRLPLVVWGGMPVRLPPAGR